MRKGLVILMAAAMVLAFAGVALAIDITPETYSLAGKDWQEYSQGNPIAGAEHNYQGFDSSAHVYGTWNSPYTEGIDGYNYNDSQEAVETGHMVDTNADGVNDLFTSGPHGGYLTSTHRCRECHAVHRAAGKFKLLRSDTRFEACDWCHGNGAGSGFNIQMDNDTNYTTEYNVGHSMGFGVSSGKWKAPDDTYPAFTPNYWQGGFSCFDCHSPHANPSRLLGYNDAAQPVGVTTHNVDTGETNVYSIANPGHDLFNNDGTYINEVSGKKEPIYLAGSWLLIKNPDREIAKVDTTVASGIVGGSNITIVAGSEIPDAVTANLNEYSASKGYPVNKVPIDWDSPVGPAGKSDVGFETVGFDRRNMSKRIWNVSEFCTDCHDGNAGLHTVQAPLFSEERALRHDTESTETLAYDLAYGHDAQPRH